MVNCSVLDCKSRSERKYQNITFHSFPSDIEARKLWIEAAGHKNWQPTKFSRICSKHFEAHCFEKKKTYTVMIKGSIPELLLPPPMPPAVRVKQEPGTPERAAAALYAEHEVKEELVLGPERLQPQDIAFALRAEELSSTAASEPLKQEGEEAPGAGCGPPVVLNYCFVRLERMIVDKELYPCKLCLKIFVLKASLMTHTCLAKRKPSLIFKDSADKASFPCNACGKLFVTESKLKTHVLIHTTGKDNQLSCQLSNQVLHEPEEAGHRKNQSAKKPYACDICYSQFDLKTNLTKHRLTHAVEKLHTCDICTKQFSRKSFLDAHHQLNHTGQNPYTCNICQKGFTQRSSLFRHRLIHKGENPYTCEFCDRIFLNKTNYTKHMSIHTMKIPYTCDICYKQFLHKTNLTKHMLIHTVEKPHTCNICNKHFLNKTELTNHNNMSIHTVEKPHTCDICYKQFLRQDYLDKHMLIHAKGEPYTCDLCNQQFSLKYYLDTHRAIHKQKLTLYI